MKILRRDYGVAYLDEIGEPDTNGHVSSRLNLAVGPVVPLAKCTFDVSYAGDFGLPVPGFKTYTIASWEAADPDPDTGKPVLTMTEQDFSADYFEGRWGRCSWVRRNATYANHKCELPSVFVSAPPLGIGSGRRPTYAGGFDGSPFWVSGGSLVHKCLPQLGMRLDVGDLLYPWWGGPPVAFDGTTTMEQVDAEYARLTGIEGFPDSSGLDAYKSRHPEEGCWAARATAEISVSNGQFDPDTGEGTGYGYGIGYDARAIAVGWFVSPPRHRIGGSLTLRWWGDKQPFLLDESEYAFFANKDEIIEKMTQWGEELGTHLESWLESLRMEVTLSNAHLI